MNFDRMYHGADYNPEQWKDYPGIIDEDIRLMKLAHCNVMNINIFSWTELEKEEGVYDFSFLDMMMDKLGENGIKVILATPSAARPAWMSKTHPEVLRVGADRRRNLHGFRHNHCYTSPYYRQKVYEMNKRLAERYQNHPALLMWHLSNEYGGECHCELCQEAFRNWLKDKYHNDLDILNHKYWSKFWSHTYTDWEQIESPSPLGETQVHALNLDWKRFVTHQTMEFIKNEAAPLKELTPDIPVTANMVALVGDIDYHQLKNVIDIVSWDCYPDWHGRNDVYEASVVGFHHDFFRTLKEKPFFLMESTPSLVNWREYCKPKRPGVHKLSALQAIAHGSNSIEYFQWRKSRGSSEKMHGAVVDHCGHENTRVFRDVAEVGMALEKLSDVVDTNTKSEVAVIFDWENRWALNDMQGMGQPTKNYNRTCFKHYGLFWRNGINTDVIGPNSDFSKYKLIVAPMLYMTKKGFDEKVAEYVKNGGRIVFTYASGWVDENDLCYLGGFPGGKLKEVLGIWAEEIDTLFPNESNLVLTEDGKEYKAIDYCEVIHSEGAEVIGTYRYDFYAGMPAATVNSYGKGRAYYVAFRDEGEFIERLYNDILKELDIEGEISALPYGVTAHTREDDQFVYVFVENYTTEEKTVFLGCEYLNMLTMEMIWGNTVMKKYEALVLRRSK